MDLQFWCFYLVLDFFFTLFYVFSLALQGLLTMLVFCLCLVSFGGSFLNDLNVYLEHGSGSVPGSLCR